MLLRNSFAVSMNLSCSTAMLISPLRVSHASASDPLPYFQRLDRAKGYHMSLLVSDCAGTPQRAEGLCRQRAGLRVLKRVLRSLAAFGARIGFGGS
jgi:hypothetical protein